MITSMTGFGSADGVVGASRVRVDLPRRMVKLSFPGNDTHEVTMPCH